MSACTNYIKETVTAVALCVGLQLAGGCGAGPKQSPPQKDAGPIGPHCAIVPDGGFPLDGGIIVMTVNSDIPFISASGLTMDVQGNLYAASWAEQTLVELSAAGIATYLGAPGRAEPNGWPDASVVATGQNGTILDAPFSVAVTGSGELVITDLSRNDVVHIDSAGQASIFAGTGDAGYADGSAGESEFNRPTGVVVDDAGNTYVSDDGQRLRRIDPEGNVTTIGTIAGLGGLAIDGSGLIYAALEGGSICMIDQSGSVTTLAGTEPGYLDGPAATAKFNLPSAVAVDNLGNVYVADTGNNRVRKIDATGIVTTIAGDGNACEADGTGGPDGTAELEAPDSLAITSDGDLFVGSVPGVLRLIHFAQ